ncbi:MAG: antibiotic biosynthesis monooxygenase [Anaerolineales bacterium]|nr:antibiotic biosynthesis monooxygenase [Anaerolineales bacterium]
MLDTGQFTLYATFLAHEGKFEETKALCQESLRLTKTAVGVQQAICLEPPQPEKPFVVVSIWRTKEDFQQFLQTPEMKAFHNKTAVQEMFKTALQTATADFYTLMDSWVTSH